MIDGNPFSSQEPSKPTCFAIPGLGLVVLVVTAMAVGIGLGELSRLIIG
ncbi:hypothetical protein [Roseibium sediminis]|nr:hypothetical protein [Roseibium sediminis]